MNIIQTAKELLKKGIALNDTELIKMANELIEANTKSEDVATVEPVKTKKPKARRAVTPQVEMRRSNIVEQFKLAAKDNETSKRTPVTDRKRYNSWTDDGVESKEIVTPDVPITKRTREPVKKVKQQCQLCQSTEMVNPVHVRDFYICDSCLLNKNKGRS